MHEAMRYRPQFWIRNRLCALLGRPHAMLCIAWFATAACHSPRAAELAPAARLPNQPPSARMPTELLVTVLGYRAHYIERTTPIDACSMVRAMATPGDYPARLPAFVRAMLNRQDATPCTALPPVAGQDTLGTPAIARVAFESFDVSGSDGVVRLRVRAGENMHREDYYLHVVTPGVSWGISEVRLSEAMRVYFVHP